MAQRNTIVSKGVIQTVVVGIIYGVIGNLTDFILQNILNCCYFIKIQRSPLMHPQNILPIWDISIGLCQFSMYAARQLRDWLFRLAIFSGVIENDCEMFCIIVFVPIAGDILHMLSDQTAWIVCSTLLCIYFSYCFKRFKKNDDIQEVSYDTSF